MFHFIRLRRRSRARPSRRTCPRLGAWHALARALCLSAICAGSELPCAGAQTAPDFNTPVDLSIPSNLTGDHPPRLTRGIRPNYPPEYAAGEVEGKIIVDFTVCPDGSVTQVHSVDSPDPRLSQLAVAAVMRWEFSPGIRNGRPAYMHMRVPVVFQAPTPKAASGAAQSLDPNSVAASSVLLRGRSEFDRKDFPAAAADFDAAIRLTPDSAAAYLGRALAYAQLERRDEALGDYVQAALLDPADQGALDAYRKALPDTPESRWVSLRYQTFITVWRTVNETYFDAAFGGVDWLAIREKYRVRLSEIHDDAHLIDLLQQMLGELRRTHFSIVPRKAAVFNPSERTRIGTDGAEVAFIDGGVVVIDVKPGSTGAAAGMHPGDLITEVDGVAIPATLEMLEKAGLTRTRSEEYVTKFVEARLGSAVGSQVKIKLSAPEPGAAARQLTVTSGANDAQWSEPIGYFPSLPIRCEAVRNPDGIAYLQFNIFVPPVMRQVRSLLRQLKDGDGLIVDLRGNGGGISVMASGICGWLCRSEFVLGTMHKRDGMVNLDVYPQSHVFDGPVAILVDGLSASTSEIFAAGLKERHRARLFGEPTAGAALPSLFKSLPTGDLFQFAVADVTTPSGALLEGNGVAPDEVVLRSRSDLASGRDPVMDAARAWINSERTRSSTATGAAR
jgi:carboxyl-terminal processing protease